MRKKHKPLAGRPSRLHRNTRAALLGAAERIVISSSKEANTVTNNQAEAYAKRAMRKCKLSADKAERILSEMRYLFDTISEREVCRKEFGCDT